MERSTNIEDQKKSGTKTRKERKFGVVLTPLSSCSDQFDPFNRAPLTMEMVVPNTELKEKIDQWKRENNISTS